MKVIGVSGLARAGKDTFCSIAEKILAKNGYKAKRYSFANALKKEVEPFLKNNCSVDVWTQDTELKTDIRDFLVWYGTTFWRKRDPNRWIRSVDVALKNESMDASVALVSDVRYPNEGEWIHSHGGYLVHVASWKWLPADYGRELGGHDSTEVRTFMKAPNEQERINDPIVTKQSDYKMEWEMKVLPPDEVLNDQELNIEVLKALNSSQLFTSVLNL
jgi:hypothetical protein